MAISDKAHPLTVPMGLSESEISQHTLTTRDNIQLYYEFVGQGDRTVVLANGLGGRLYSWAPILRAFRDRFGFVTWDYRGLFESDAPDEIRRLSIQDHAEDLKEILDASGEDSVIVAGWSMGVQVGLEFATLYPDYVDALILLNGTYGKIFSSGFQPIFPLPYTHDFLHKTVEWLESQTKLIEYLGDWIKRYMDMIVNAQIALSPGSYNRSEMRRAMKQYVMDIFGTEFENYLRLFQELDAHSVYHNLPHIDIPALIISGGLDILTPAYLSREMTNRMPRARHRNLWLANHFAMLEYPEEVADEIATFLDDTLPA